MSLQLPDFGDLERIVTTTDHRNIFESLIADVVDLIPFVGEGFAGAKALDARKKGNQACALALGTDTIIADIVPANLLCLILAKREVTSLFPSLPRISESFG